jgi:hypothetical protein
VGLGLSQVSSDINWCRSEADSAWLDALAKERSVSWAPREIRHLLE